MDMRQRRELSALPARRRSLSFPAAAVLLASGFATLLAWVGSSADSLRRSDTFWRALQVNGLDAEHYDDIRSLYRASDLVVVARFVDLQLGRQVVDRFAIEGGAPETEATVSFAHAQLEVERTISSGTSTETVTVQFLLPDAARIDVLRETLPTERAIFFLRDMWAKAQRAGYAGASVERLVGIYDLVVSSSVVRDIDGQAAPVEGAPPYIADIEGSDFAGLSFEP